LISFKRLLIFCLAWASSAVGLNLFAHLTEQNFCLSQSCSDIVELIFPTSSYLIQGLNVSPQPEHVFDAKKILSLRQFLRLFPARSGEEWVVPGAFD